jgi:primosomal protein N' (replication factor Y)
MTRRTVDVLVPVALDRAYSYSVPPGLDLKPGDVVAVPLGARETVGVVWGDGPVDPKLHNRLKPVSGVVEVAPLDEPLRRFVDWVSHYTLGARGMVLRSTLRFGTDLGAERMKVGIRLAGPPPRRMTSARERVLALVADGLVRAKAEISEEAGVSSGVVDALVDEGTLEAVALPPAPIARHPDADFAAPDLTPAQRAAATSLAARVGAGFSVTLVDGVTGSGKTEVYFEAVAAALRAGRQVLILMPEIALTAQVLDRFTARFGTPPAVWHSQIGARKRDRTWKAVASGEVRVVAGARSALFLPFREPGLIVVDEEHDVAYKQDDGVHYHARDMAVVRGRLQGLPVVLASATPSVETEVNARQGRYERVRLPARFGGQGLPTVSVIDMRRHAPPRGRWISDPLSEAMGEALKAGGQSLLFLNRRGYAPLTLCKSCGHRIDCPNCDAWLVEHRFRRRLVCHQCGFAAPKPDACPSCDAVEPFVPVGPGVERLSEEVAALHPQARIIVLSSDVAAGPQKLGEDLQRIAEGEFDVIVGTQIVAKGHNFPRLTLVGVVDADFGLGHGDPRAPERTFQLLHQVAGRAGRGDRPGHALLQTHMPDHPVIGALASGDRDTFYDREIAARETAGLPPFGRLAALVVSAPTAPAAQAHAQLLVRAAPHVPEVRVLGPAEAPIALIRGRHRFRILAKSARRFDLSAYVRQWMASAPDAKGGVSVEVDIDPQSFS